MKYLVIGDSNSMHIYNFVKTVLLPRKYEVHLLTLSTRPIREEYLKFYHEHEVVVHSIAEKGYKDLEKSDYFHRILHFFRKLRLMKDVPMVDICHVQSVYKTSLVMVLRNRRKYKKLILSYWGGDIEERSESVVKLRAKCFEFADIITVTVKQTYNEFQELYGTRYNSKLRICRFATDGLNCIHELSKNVSRRDCQKSYDIPENKICITCGYSAYAAQHQDLCLETIQGLDVEIKKRLFVIVPMQYGRFDEAYIRRVKDIAARSDFACTVLEEYVPFEMSAKLAIATDIYLHLRDTDAFSNALKEHVFAGSYVIKGDWLCYPELEEMGAKMRSIASFEELGDILNGVLKELTISPCVTLFEPIYQLYSTEAIKKQWFGVIDSVLASSNDFNFD